MKRRKRRHYGRSLVRLVRTGGRGPARPRSETWRSEGGHQLKRALFQQAIAWLASGVRFFSRQHLPWASLFPSLRFAPWGSPGLFAPRPCLPELCASRGAPKAKRTVDGVWTDGGLEFLKVDSILSATRVVAGISPRETPYPRSSIAGGAHSPETNKQTNWSDPAHLL